MSGNVFAASSAFTGSGSQFGSTDVERPRALLLAHAWLMILAWSVFAPFGVITARFLKNKLGDKWFPIHKIFLGAGTMVFSIVALILVVVRMVDADATHFDPSRYATGVGGAHVIMGIIIIALMLFQIVGGVLIDKWFDPARTKVPVSDMIHWWLGRTLLLAGIHTFSPAF